MVSAPVVLDGGGLSMDRGAVGAGRTLGRDDAGYDVARRGALWKRTCPIVSPTGSCRPTPSTTLWRRCGRRRPRVSAWESGPVGIAGRETTCATAVCCSTCRVEGVQHRRGGDDSHGRAGLGGSVLLAELMKRDLFFPVGHCRGVCIGGYLLQGGFGWNGRVLGPACASVMAIDYVDADGELRHASEAENAEMLWAARGSGPGFFGVAVRSTCGFTVKPGFIGMPLIQYPVDRLEDLVRWMVDVSAEVPPQVELQFLVSRSPSFPPPLRRMRTSPVRIELAVSVFAESCSAAKAATAFLASRPKGARVGMPLLPAPMVCCIRA